MEAKNGGNVQIPARRKEIEIKEGLERDKLRKILPGSSAPSGKIFRPAVVTGQPRVARQSPQSLVAVCACSGLIGATPLDFTRVMHRQLDRNALLACLVTQLGELPIAICVACKIGSVPSKNPQN